MMVRMKFNKTGPVKFIGHLDIMRFFQKAVRRAGLDVEYSQGYNPHQVMSFASPLGVGLTSESEYVDVSFNSLEEKSVVLAKLNAAMNEFIQVTDMVMLPEGFKNAMASVAAADYLVSLKDGYDYLSMEEFQKKFSEFMAKDEIVILKKTKKSEIETDIRPFIYAFSYSSQEFFQSYSIENDLAENYDNGVKVYLKLSSGSVNNLKPELIFEAFAAFAGIPYYEFAFQIHRYELYQESKTEEKVFLPLIEVGNEA